MHSSLEQSDREAMPLSMGPAMSQELTCTGRTTSLAPNLQASHSRPGPLAAALTSESGPAQIEACSRIYLLACVSSQCSPEKL